MTNITAASAGVKPHQEVKNFQHNNEEKTPDVFEELLAALRNNLQEGTQAGDAGQPQNTAQLNEAEATLGADGVVKDEDVLSTVFATSNDHADSFAKVGIFGHKQEVFSERGEQASSSDSEAFDTTIKPEPFGINTTDTEPLAYNKGLGLDEFSNLSGQRNSNFANKTSIASGAKNIANQKESSSKNGVNTTQVNNVKSTLIAEYNVDANGIEVEEVNVEQAGAEAEVQDTERQQARTTSVYRAIAEMPNSQVHIALYALERGLRLFARVSDLSNGERAELRDKINNVLAQHGMSGTEVIIENYPGSNNSPENNTNKNIGRK